MRSETMQRVSTPTALLVGLPEDLALRCIDALSNSGLRVLRVGHAAAASERIPVIMPQLVIFAGRLHPTEREALNDRCVAVGAEVLVAPPPNSDVNAFLSLLMAAADVAREKAARASEGR